MRRDDRTTFVSFWPNSQLITDAKAGRIRRVLSGDHDAETARFRFYVRSKRLSLVDLPLFSVIGLSLVLCAPAPKVSSKTNI